MYVGTIIGELQQKEREWGALKYYELKQEWRTYDSLFQEYLKERIDLDELHNELHILQFDVPSPVKAQPPPAKRANVAKPRTLELTEEQAKALAQSRQVEEKKGGTQFVLSQRDEEDDEEETGAKLCPRCGKHVRNP